MRLSCRAGLDHCSGIPRWGGLVLALCWWVLEDESLEFANVVREGDVKISD